MILDIDSSLGYPEIGALLSGVLFGIFTMQVYISQEIYINFSKVFSWIKFGLVDSMWFFELAHTICEFYGLYYVTVFHYGDPTIFLAVPHELAAVPLFDGLIAIIGKYYSCKDFLHTESRNLRVLHTPFPLSVVFSWFAKWWLRLDYQLQFLRNGTLTISWISGDALVYNLIKNRSNTTCRSTYVIIDKLIQWAIETGVVTSSVSIIVMICFLINPTNFLWVAFYAVLPKFTELITIPLPGTTAQSLEVRTNLPETPHVPSESIIQEGHQLEIKALPVTQD
ncbi:hypothetical protein C8R41DRAFT_867193 [Lentinula lateritia]|uniref:DUF6534 domain-containing protein n=1 Tax=Lentinula lateritia TaxID=40482 RepID=A0ABQ8VH88_9AGAR|nr:hypothetical protein C8R41DRAFT_867193 [Lentinula lateritia]